MIQFDGVKIFSATTFRDRDALDDRATEWLKNNKDLRVVDKDVMQSSDDAFHCISIIFFWCYV